MTDLTEHTPARPGWRCSACGDEWPCAPAKVRLSDEYRLDTSRLLTHLARQMWEAFDDGLTDDRSVAVPLGLRERFLGWVCAPFTDPPSR